MAMPAKEKRRRDRCRLLSRRLERDGVLVRQPCEKCGKAEVQMHHEDYDRPDVVAWLCQRCHVRHHFGDRARERPRRQLNVGLHPKEREVFLRAAKAHGMNLSQWVRMVLTARAKVVLGIV